MNKLDSQHIASNKKDRALYILITLALLSAFGPFVTDLYLPALPSLTDYFETSASTVQLSLSLSMLGLALGQVLIGPISDKYGRIKPLLICMWLFVISTIACLFSWDIYSFVAFRLIQGIAGAGGVVLSKSIPTDMFSGKELVKYLAIIGAINGIAPVISPVLGGVMLEFTNWKGMFVLLLSLGVLILFLSYKLEESLPLAKRNNKNVFTTFVSLGKVFRNLTYTYNALTMVMAAIVLFSYIASSPFILQEHFGFSPLVFSLCFALNAAAIAVGSLLSMRFNQPKHSIIIGSSGLFIFALASAFCLYLNMPFVWFEGTLMFMLICLGLVFPAATALAMDAERENAGAASAVIGSLTFLAGSVCTPLVGMGNLLHSTALCLLTGAILTVLFCFLARKNEKNRESKLQMQKVAVLPN